MVTKTQPIAPGSMLSVQDIQAWYLANPFPLGSVDAWMPLERTEQDSWKTVSNASYMLNEAADPLSTHSKIPVAGREGFKSVMGEMASFGKGREMDSKQLQRFEQLKQQFAATRNPGVAQQLVDFYGNDLAFLRIAMNAERMYLSHALLSNACSIGMVAANSPYLQSLANVVYPVSAWQKDEVATTWANAASLILDDIETVKTTLEGYGKFLGKIKINRTWFNHVRKNTQVQKYCATLVQTLTSTQTSPTLEQINSMMAQYFDADIQFEVVDEKITRALANGTKVTASPFEDGVAVFTATTQVGRFAWKPIYIDDVTRETYESFFLVGNYKNVDPSYSKIYAKAEGFPVIDTFADNFYLRVNGVSW